MSRILDDCYQELANAIIIQAAEDYRTALRVLKKHPYNKTDCDEREVIECFFRSDWFGILTKLNPEFLINKLNEEAFS
jgi:hypothetical protein